MTARLHLALLLTLGIAGCSSTTSRPAPARLPEGYELRAYVTNFEGGTVSVIDPVGARLITNISTGAKPHGVAIAPDGKAVYVSNEGDGTLSIIDPSRNEVVASVVLGRSPHQLTTSVDGRHIFVALNGQDAIAVVDVEARSALSRRAAETGLALARAVGGEVALVHVADSSLAYAPEGGVPASEVLSFLDRDGRLLLASIAKDAQLSKGLTQLLQQGKPGPEVVQAAKDWGADLIVLGTHGRGGVHRLLMGSVADQVVRHAPP